MGGFPMSDPLVGIGELAAATGLSIKKLRRMADRGDIPSTRTSGGHRRFDPRRVHETLRTRSGSPKPSPVSAQPLEPATWQSRQPLAALREDVVWDELARAQIDPEVAARPIFRYAFTEMLNNAIDHSDGTQVNLFAWISDDRLAFLIRDDGVGAFAKLREGLGLTDHFAAVQELSKGKRTTWPEHHTGEGIFFTSKAVDVFQLVSNGVRWTVDNVRQDVGLGDVPDEQGTSVYCEVIPATARTLREVFAKYTTDDHAFRVTRPIVKLFGYGVSFVSRSEAKRLLDGLDDFDDVLVDFTGVTDVGQGFVDELLRVWPRSHPGKQVIPINMSNSVEFMIRRGLSPGNK